MWILHTSFDNKEVAAKQTARVGKILLCEPRTRQPSCLHRLFLARLDVIRLPVVVMERYSLQKVIGEGSFGRALLVRCKSTQEKYVVKEVQLPKVFSDTHITTNYCCLSITCEIIVTQTEPPQTHQAFVIKKTTTKKHSSYKQCFTRKKMLDLHQRVKPSCLQTPSFQTVVSPGPGTLPDCGLAPRRGDWLFCSIENASMIVFAFL